MIAERAHYRLIRESDASSVCVREARTTHGAEMLPRHFAGWQLVHPSLGDAAPHFAEFDGVVLRTELIPGQTAARHYALRISGERTESLPWAAFWQRLERLYERAPAGRANPKLNSEMSWTTWFAIARLDLAKRHALADCLRHPFWAAEAAMVTLRGRAAGGYTRPPAVVFDIARASMVALTTGDMHMENLVGDANRIAFVDFSEVADGPVALELTPLWIEWWLAQGLVSGDDGFLDGFSALWRRFVGAEALLVRLTAEFVSRMFSWLLFAFFADHLELGRRTAEDAVARTRARLRAVHGALAHGTELRELIAEAGR